MLVPILLFQVLIWLFWLSFWLLGPILVVGVVLAVHAERQRVPSTSPADATWAWLAALDNTSSLLTKPSLRPHSPSTS